MEYEEIMNLWDRFDASKATRLDIKKGDFRFSLRKEENHSVVMPVSGGAVQGSAPEGSLLSADTQQEESDNAVLAPLAGTFYRASSPDADVYVEVGQKVHKGDVIGVIEAMKLYNEVQADRDGVVWDILVENGQLVEYHQALMTIG